MAVSSTKTHNRTNNVAAAANVFAEYGDFIRTVICYQVKNETQADDLFQDFFLYLVVRPLPTGVRNIKSYLYKAITNDIIDATRRVEKYQNRILKYTKRTNHSINIQNPEDILTEAEETDKMFELIEKRLRHSQAQAITLRYRNNYNIKEVAKQMNVDNASVRRYVSIGLNKMRLFLTNSKARY
jgi:RNA polymerase sigma factor (sigma-70 family)